MEVAGGVWVVLVDGALGCISKTTLCSVESVQLITENYRKVPSKDRKSVV